MDCVAASIVHRPLKQVMSHIENLKVIEIRLYRAFNLSMREKGFFGLKKVIPTIFLQVRVMTGQSSVTDQWHIAPENVHTILANKNS